MALNKPKAEPDILVRGNPPQHARRLTPPRDKGADMIPFEDWLAFCQFILETEGQEDKEDGDTEDDES